jgi:hypothetical protein
MVGALRQRRPDGSIVQTPSVGVLAGQAAPLAPAGPGSLLRSPSWRPPRCAPPRPRTSGYGAG